jgi:hypothetical protein
LIPLKPLATKLKEKLFKRHGGKFFNVINLYNFKELI